MAFNSAFKGLIRQEQNSFQDQIWLWRRGCYDCCWL